MDYLRNGRFELSIVSLGDIVNCGEYNRCRRKTGAVEENIVSSIPMGNGDFYFSSVGKRKYLLN